MRQKSYSPYFLKNPYMFFPLSALFLFAVNGSEDASSYPSWIIQFSSFVSEKIPLISGYVEKSKFKTITQIYMSVCIFLFPLHLMLGYQELLFSTGKDWHKSLWTINSWGSALRRLITVLVISFISITTFALGGGYDFNLLPINSSRLALGFGGWVLVGGGQAAGLTWSACSVIAIYRFFKGV